LDVDGVLVLVGRKFHRPAVAELNYFIREVGPDNIRIVFNTAWNLHTVDEMRTFLVVAGFEYPTCLHGQTAGTQGGGGLAREWLRDNDGVGTPYIMIDDSTRCQASWGRLAQCITAQGMTRKVADKAVAIYQRGIADAETELQHVEANILADNFRIVTSTPWLSDEERYKYTQRNLDDAREIVSDPNFMQSACLIR
jgi:hypothetical protein